jgi:hypothetical protein
MCICATSYVCVCDFECCDAVDVVAIRSSCIAGFADATAVVLQLHSIRLNTNSLFEW